MSRARSWMCSSPSAAPRSSPASRAVRCRQLGIRTGQELYALVKAVSFDRAQCRLCVAVGRRAMKPEVRFHIRDSDLETELAHRPGQSRAAGSHRGNRLDHVVRQELGMSYRRAWLLVEETNRCLVRPAVEPSIGGRRGGGTALTPVGIELVRRYRALERQTSLAVDPQAEVVVAHHPARLDGSAHSRLARARDSVTPSRTRPTARASPWRRRSSQCRAARRRFSPR